VKWQIYPSTFVHPGGPSFPGKALQNILHRAQANLRNLSCTALVISLEQPGVHADPSLGVSYELCDPPNSVGTSQALVGYSIRLESNISRNTRLAFVTNGIALRMLEGGSGQGGQGTAFDEVTVCPVLSSDDRSLLTTN